jgi:hypothetical protein
MTFSLTPSRSTVAPRGTAHSGPNGGFNSYRCSLFQPWAVSGALLSRYSDRISADHGDCGDAIAGELAGFEDG